MHVCNPRPLPQNNRRELGSNEHDNLSSLRGKSLLAPIEKFVELYLTSKYKNAIISRMKSRIITPIIAGSLFLTGCEAAPQTNEKTPSVTATDLRCDARLDTNYITVPEDVAEIARLPWVVTTERIGNLAVNYYRDCGLDVRGPVDDEYPLGALLISGFCMGDKLTLSDTGNNLPDNRLGALYAESAAILPNLQDITSCSTGKITPIQ